MFLSHYGGKLCLQFQLIQSTNYQSDISACNKYDRACSFSEYLVHLVLFRDMIISVPGNTVTSKQNSVSATFLLLMYPSSHVPDKWFEVHFFLIFLHSYLSLWHVTDRGEIPLWFDDVWPEEPYHICKYCWVTICLLDWTLIKMNLCSVWDWSKSVKC